MDDKSEGELLHGARAIGQFLGFNERQVRHHFREGRLPVFKVGETLVASKEKLREWIKAASG